MEQQQAAEAVTVGGRTNWRWVSSASLSLSLLSRVWVSPAKAAQVNSEREISRAPSPYLWRVGKQGSRLQTIPLPRTPKWRLSSSPRRHSDALPA
jgi:hypothetical protein